MKGSAIGLSLAILALLIWGPREGAAAIGATEMVLVVLGFCLGAVSSGLPDAERPPEP